MSQISFTPSFEQAKIIASDIRIQFPKLAARVNGNLEKAVVIASTPAAVIPANDGPAPLWIIQSQSNPLGHYEVDEIAHTCTCPDHGAHGQAGIVCKHRLAAYIWRLSFSRWFVAPEPRQPQLGDIGRVIVNHPILGRFEVAARLLEIRQSAALRGATRFEVEALASNPHGYGSRSFDYRKPFVDGTYQTQWASIDPRNWTTTLPVEAQEAQ